MSKILETGEVNTPGRPNLYKPNDPPLVSLQVTNPITYLKLWLKKVWANEGIVLHLRIRPLTIITIALLFSGASFGISKYLAAFLPFDVFPPTPTPAPTQKPTPTPVIWIEAAYAGSLHRTEDNRFYVVVSSGEAIILEVPSGINLDPLIGKRILAYGQYNPTTRILKVISATDMEILPTKSVPVPTSVPAPSG